MKLLPDITVMAEVSSSKFTWEVPCSCPENFFNTSGNELGYKSNESMKSCSFPAP